MCKTTATSPEATSNPLVVLAEKAEKYGSRRSKARGATMIQRKTVKQSVGARLKLFERPLHAETPAVSVPVYAIGTLCSGAI